MPVHTDLLVGPDNGDDAAVWKVAPDRALVLTLDFITPVVDDPRVFGRIAATNAVSDVYAMGGKPLLALNIVAWNTEQLGVEVLSQVLEGAAEAAGAGGWVTVGGHSVEDPEPKFGLSAVGEVHPDRMLTNAGLQPGQALVLTKPLGVGVLTTAIKKEGPLPDDVYSALVRSMTRLNGEAAQAAVAASATGATDVTGFGLLGHLRRMVEASGVGAEVFPAAVPVLPMARDQAAQGKVPAGSKRNLAWVSPVLDRAKASQTDLFLLADAQTSGGLLFGAEPTAAQSAVADLNRAGHQASVVGMVTQGGGISLVDGRAV